MNIFLRELKANRKALIIWSVCMFLLVISGMGKFTAYSSGGSVGNQIFNDMPKSVKALLGIGPFDVTQMIGFYALLFLYIELTAAIHAVLLGAGIISKEERDKTTEFLITKPVSRTTIITSKLLAALVNIAILNIVTLLSSLVIIPVYNNGPDLTSQIIMFDISMFLVQLIFLAAGAALAACMKRSKGSGSIAAGILLATFMVSKVTDFNDNLNFLNVLSPFKYFDYVRIVEGNGFNAVVVLLSLLLTAFLVASTYYTYRRRDIAI